MPHIAKDDAQAILVANFAPWVLATGITVTTTADDKVTLTIPNSDQLCRVGGMMCGQALATGADTAMVIAIASALGGFKPVTTVDMTVNFMRPVAGADAVLEASVMRLGKSLAFCRCDVRDAGSSKAAGFATGTYALL